VTSLLLQRLWASATVDPAPTVVAFATVVAFPTVVDPTVTPSNSVPTLHLNLVVASTLPIVLDTGASYSIIPFALDFTQASYGLHHASVLVASKVASIDPHTLITGEDTAFPVDLLSAVPILSLILPLLELLSFANSEQPL